MKKIERLDPHFQGLRCLAWNPPQPTVPPVRLLMPLFRHSHALYPNSCHAHFQLSLAQDTNVRKIIEKFVKHLALVIFQHHGGKVKTYTYGGHGWYKEQTHGYRQGMGGENGHSKETTGGRLHGSKGNKESPYWSSSDHFGGWKQSHGHN